MHVHKTDIEGVFIFEPTVYQDARGYFYESFRKDVYASSGIQESFVQDSVSYSHHNVLRGLHVSAQGKRLRRRLRRRAENIIQTFFSFTLTQ